MYNTAYRSYGLHILYTKRYTGAMKLMVHKLTSYKFDLKQLQQQQQPASSKTVFDRKNFETQRIINILSAFRKSLKQIFLSE
jgi:hypothetical protein